MTTLNNDLLLLVRDWWHWGSNILILHLIGKIDKDLGLQDKSLKLTKEH